MRLNDDEKTVAAMDILVPGVGEIVGGWRLIAGKIVGKIVGKLLGKIVGKIHVGSIVETLHTDNRLKLPYSIRTLPTA